MSSDETKEYNQYFLSEGINNEDEFFHSTNVPEVVFQDELYEEYQIYIDETEEANDIIYEEAVQDYDDEKAYQYFKETQFTEPPIVIGKNKRKRRKQFRNQNKPKTRETAYDNMKVVDKKTCGQQRLKELIDKNSKNIQCLTCNMEYFITKQSYNKYKIIIEKNEEGGDIYNFVCPVCAMRSTCTLI
ncbi:Hypothetical protein SRAE_1000266100 [Strongyloides ratti]|uniref:Uncharacterized protein n=1 Tax=Strongyloides ratti TaxID=34506 RepID=A0A090L3V8_STRRB|nr:Hypothetical protein SRAE_1000266100 [Strongyloides ratti]CEF64407.1 Hypothetical protein SRAE_1000266100 [Strongyloides ratti]